MTSGLVRKWRQKPQKVLVLQRKVRLRIAHNPEVVGSSPASATIKSEVHPKGWASFFARAQYLNPQQWHCPVDSACHQCKHWWLHLFSLSHWTEKMHIKSCLRNHKKYRKQLVFGTFSIFLMLKSWKFQNANFLRQHFEIALLRQHFQKHGQNLFKPLRLPLVFVLFGTKKL